MKRLFGAVLALICLTVQMPTAGAVGTCASAAVLMDASSGRVLYGHNAHEPRPIASITKLMTALVALESGHELDETVTVAPEWAATEGSSIYLRPGEEVSLELLLYGMLLRSGNDAALAVAGCCGGSVEAFVSMMNEKARELGMADSHFENPNGLDAEGHFSSAYDMALLARACLENETLAQIVSTKSIALGTRSFTNHNKLLWRYEGCIGLKTGYTQRAGRTLVSAARRDGLTLICVTLNDPDDWADHKALLDHGSQTYRSWRPVRAGETVGQLPVEGGLVPVCPVVAASDVTAALGAGEDPAAEVSLRDAVLSAPVEKGDLLGELVFSLDGEELARVRLLAGADVACDRAEKTDFFHGLLERIAGLDS